MFIPTIDPLPRPPEVFKTGNLFKLVHLRTPYSSRHLVVAVGENPTAMHFLLKIVLTHDVNDAAVHAGFGQEGERAVVFIISSRIYAPDVLVNSAIVRDIV